MTLSKIAALRSKIRHYYKKTAEIRIMGTGIWSTPDPHGHADPDITEYSYVFQCHHISVFVTNIGHYGINICFT